MKEMIAGLMLALIAGITLLAYQRRGAYRDLLPVFVTLILCAAAFFIGAYLGGDSVRSELITLIEEDDLDFAAQFGGGIPLFEIMVVCTLAVAFFLALQLILQVTESNED